MTRIRPSSAGGLGMSGSIPLGGCITPFCLLSLSLSDPGGASGTGLIGTALLSIFSDGVLLASAGVGDCGEPCPAPSPTKATVIIDSDPKRNARRLLKDRVRVGTRRSCSIARERSDDPRVPNYRRGLGGEPRRSIEAHPPHLIFGRSAVSSVSNRLAQLLAQGTTGKVT